MSGLLNLDVSFLLKRENITIQIKDKAVLPLPLRGLAPRIFVLLNKRNKHLKSDEKFGLMHSTGTCRHW